MNSTVSQFFILFTLIFVSTCMFSMEQQDATAHVVPIHPCEIKRTLYQPKSLVVTLLPHVANSETLEQDLSQLPEDLRENVNTVIQLLKETQDIKKALLKALDVYRNKKEGLTVSLSDIELLFYLYTSVKPIDLSEIPSDVLDNIFKIIYTAKGDFSLVAQWFLMLYFKEKWTNIANTPSLTNNSNLIRDLEIIFGLGASGNVCIKGTETNFEKMEIHHRFQPVLLSLVMDFITSLQNNGRPSLNICNQEDKQLSLKLIKLLLNQGANPNECWDHSIPEDTEDLKIPLLTNYINNLYTLFKEANNRAYIDFDLIKLLLDYGYNFQVPHKGFTLVQLGKRIIELLSSESEKFEKALQQFKELVELLENYSKNT